MSDSGESLYKQRKNMELREVKELLPLYAANALSSEERTAVDDALKSSKELNTELAFWRKAQLTADSHAAYARAQHLSSELIVDYAERAITDHQLRSTIESHLQRCDECRDEYEMILQTMPKLETHRQITPSMIERLQGFVASFKPVYVLRALAVLVAVIVLWRGIEKRFDENTARFVIPFQEQLRTEDESLPILTLDESVKRVQLVLCIPHDSLVSTQYTAILSTPAGTSIALPETFSKIIASQTDSIRINLTADMLHAEGEYALNLDEVPSSLPPGASAFRPEPYRFIVKNVKKQ
jgi:hypothetical protein